MTNPYEGAGAFAVGPDATNPSDRRITSPGCRHVAKVYGQTPDEAQQRAEWIVDALNAWAASNVPARTATDDLTQRQLADRDALLFGAGYMLDGQRVDPAHITVVAAVSDVPDATRAMTARIVAERVRQQTDEGRTPDWDDRHTTGGLARAAACYALHAGASASRLVQDVNSLVARFWPWDMKAWKPADPMRNLEKAGALILAEMERRARS